ncbi:hypothetical protein OSB04_016940 [Centaurea solstitialis]|uniref:Uncharacterized protein n=1 Tax=Centaurea solstitialis TaxID=347529 RepID=A0AA38TDV4_9ASTR|nr:hypothetical protein OSB04_016940 [Centaurea solstitialis]
MNPTNGPSSRLQLQIPEHLNEKPNFLRFGGPHKCDHQVSYNIGCVISAHPLTTDLPDRDYNPLKGLTGHLQEDLKDPPLADTTNLSTPLIQIKLRRTRPNIFMKRCWSKQEREKASWINSMTWPMIPLQKVRKDTANTCLIAKDEPSLDSSTKALVYIERPSSSQIILPYKIWHLDSGCSTHITGNKSLLINCV